MKYQMIDGVLYTQMDTEVVQQKLAGICETVKPYKNGIAQCLEQIRQYENQIARIINDCGLDKELIQVIDPEKASYLGL